MLNAGHHFYPRIVQEPCSSARGVMLEPTFPCTSSLNLYNTGHAELGSSFLSLLSGPPSALLYDSQQLSNPKPFIASSTPVNGCSVMVSSAGSRVSPAGILSQNLDNWTPKTGVDQQSSELAKALVHHNVSGTEKLNEFSTLRGRWLASSRPPHVGKSSSSNVQASQKVVLESNTSVPRQSSPLTSGCPRVFCLGASE